MKKAASRIVIDTNVLVTALRSRRGSSFQLLSLVGTGCFDPVLTVPLVMEYEDVLLRPGLVPVAPPAVGDLLDYLCSSGIHQTVHFLWRPRLSDVKDDLVLEAAVNGQCPYIVTWNLRDFQAAAGFGIQAVTPDTFLSHLQERKP